MIMTFSVFILAKIVACNARFNMKLHQNRLEFETRPYFVCESFVHKYGAFTRRKTKHFDMKTVGSHDTKNFCVEANKDE